VIRPPHALGFLDPNLPEKSRPLAGLESDPGEMTAAGVAVAGD
jgi:hypothetical protein